MMEKHLVGWLSSMPLWYRQQNTSGEIFLSWSWSAKCTNPNVSQPMCTTVSVTSVKSRANVKFHKQISNAITQAFSSLFECISVIPHLAIADEWWRFQCIPSSIHKYIYSAKFILHVHTFLRYICWCGAIAWHASQKLWSTRESRNIKRVGQMQSWWPTTINKYIKLMRPYAIVRQLFIYFHRIFKYVTTFNIVNGFARLLQLLVYTEKIPWKVQSNNNMCGFERSIHFRSCFAAIGYWICGAR